MTGTPFASGLSLALIGDTVLRHDNSMNQSRELEPMESNTFFAPFPLQACHRTWYSDSNCHHNRPSSIATNVRLPALCRTGGLSALAGVEFVRRSGELWSRHESLTVYSWYCAVLYSTLALPHLPQCLYHSLCVTDSASVRHRHSAHKNGPGRQ